MNHVSKLALLTCVLGLAACDNLRDGSSADRFTPPSLPDSATASDEFLRDYAMQGADIGYTPSITHHLNSFRNEADETVLVQFMGAGTEGAGVLAVVGLEDEGAVPSFAAMGTPVDAAPSAAYSGIIMSSRQVGSGAMLEDRGSMSIIMNAQTGAMDVNGVAYSVSNRDDTSIAFEGQGVFDGAEFAAGDIRYEMLDAGTPTGVGATGSIAGLLAANGDTPALVGRLGGTGGMTINGAFVATPVAQ